MPATDPSENGSNSAEVFEGSAQRPNPRQRRFKFSRIFAICLAVAAVLTTVIRYWPRDGIQALAPIFYASPPAVSTGMAILAWLLVRKRGRRLLKWSTGLLSVGLIALLISDRPSHQQEPQSLKLGFWNIASGGLSWDGITDRIKSWDAEIIGLAESNQNLRFDDLWVRRKYWLERFPGYNIVRFPRGMRLLSKYPAELVSEGKLGKGSNFGVAKLDVDGLPLYVVMADLLSHPTLPRAPSFDSLTEILAELPEGAPVIVMGDMNTPARSIHLDTLRKTFRNTFEERGNGFYHSWPMPLPVLSLDQVWINKRIHVGSCELQWTLHSDHRPMVCTLSILTNKEIE